ncbi:MAG: hypothetical protein H0X26_07685 [Alphaproteobacteria bacterium]|nr:hypothetical protein [Alphaproteobacteria bacterium]
MRYSLNSRGFYNESCFWRDEFLGWDMISKSANLSGVCMHGLLHAHASPLVSSGLSLSIVGKLLGHTQTSTTQR